MNPFVSSGPVSIYGPTTDVDDVCEPVKEPERDDARAEELLVVGKRRCIDLD